MDQSSRLGWYEAWSLNIITTRFTGSNMVTISMQISSEEENVPAMWLEPSLEAFQMPQQIESKDKTVFPLHVMQALFGLAQRACVTHLGQS